MADQITVPTYEQIAVLLSRLATDYSAIASIFEKVFYDTTPQDVTFKMFDESGNLVEYTIPNRAKDRALILNGSGVPEGNVEASVGAIYQDTNDGNMYIKETPDGNEGWSLIVDKSYLDNFIVRGSGVPEGNVVASRGTLYLDTEASSLYIKTTMTGNTGWKLLSFDIDMSLFADIDLSNLSEIGQAILDNKANINLSNLSATGRAVINGKANVDLDNLSEEGQAIIDGKASISLDNLSVTGQAILDNKANASLNNLSDEGQAVIESKANINLSNLSDTGNLKFQFEPFAINTGTFRGNGNESLYTNMSELYRARNINETATLTVNKALVSGFLTDTYCTSKYQVHYSSLEEYNPDDKSFSIESTFELSFNFITGENITDFQAITGGYLAHRDPISVYIKNGKLYLAVNCTEESIAPDEGEDAEDNDSDESTYTFLTSLSPQAYYSVKLIYNGSWVAYINDTKVGELSGNISNLGDNEGKDYIAFGVAYFGGDSYRAPFLGTLDLDGTFIKIGNDIVWNGVIEASATDVQWTEPARSRLISDSCILTTCTGVSRNTEKSSRSISSYADGTYYVFKSVLNSQFVLASTFLISRNQPRDITTTAWESPSNLTNNGVWDGDSFAIMSTVVPAYNQLFRMFDGKTTYCRLFVDNKGPRSFYAYNPKPVRLTKVILTSQKSGYYPPNTVTIRGSNDMINFTDLGTVKMQNVANGKTREVIINTDEFYQYFEFYLTGEQTVRVPVQGTLREVKMIGEAIDSVETNKEIYWLDTSSFPVNLKILKQNNLKISNNLVFVGKCTIEYGEILSDNIYNRPFNACPYKRTLIDKKYDTSNNTWMNLYSDNWCEQGGENTFTQSSSANGVVIDLLSSYINKNYYANGSLNAMTTFNPTTSTYNTIYVDKTENQVTFKFGGTLTNRVEGINWETKGYTQEYYGN